MNIFKLKRKMTKANVYAALFVLEILLAALRLESSAPLIMNREEGRRTVKGWRVRPGFREVLRGETRLPRPDPVAMSSCPPPPGPGWPVRAVMLTGGGGRTLLRLERRLKVAPKSFYLLPLTFCQKRLYPTLLRLGPWDAGLKATWASSGLRQAWGGGRRASPSLALIPGLPRLPAGVAQQRPLLLRPSMLHT